MKKHLLFAMILSALAISCKPEAYTGPLDSPIGNWRGIRTEYYFNGGHVGSRDGCEYSAISFYPHGLCCIEGIKGAFPYNYDNDLRELIIDSTIWNVSALTGEQMVMTYLGRLQPDNETNNVEAPSSSPDGLILPIEYNGTSIDINASGYFYINEAGETIYCRFAGSKNEEGELSIEFWYDMHTDTFIPLYVEKED